MSRMRLVAHIEVKEKFGGGAAVISLLLCGLQLENSGVIRIGGKRLYRLSHHTSPSATSSCSPCGP